ncbi:hypothetical protein AB0F15_08550 [Amycolatopsis sp. NPDC026612]|uniref:hypothetical protein n=1 Tax=Amycolatopsis sp. NPDC026612 TaxID=3155466 RepID=UPI00340BAFE7
MSGEGPYTKLGAVAGALALVVTYLVAAGEHHWWPLGPVAGAPQTAPGVTVPFAPPAASRSGPPGTTVAVAEDLIGFVDGYYRSMPDTAAGWPLIGPNLHQRGRPSYDRFWSRYTGVDILDPPSVRGAQVTVRIALNPRDGGAAVVERHVLTVIRYDGALRIDADEYLGRG